MGKRVGKYEIIKSLGEGSFGKVKMGMDTETGQKVAIKILDKAMIQQQNMGAQIKKEASSSISITKLISHPNVVKMHEVLASKTKIFIVLELVEGGELFDRIVSAGRFDEATARSFFHQLIDGIKHCHAAGVAHRDLKPENLLLDDKGNLKITDFGLSALYSQPGDESRTTLLHTTCGTPNYVAPEVLEDKGYDGQTADVWSCGVILYVMLAGFLPFDEPHMSALFRKIQKAEFSFPVWFTVEARSLISSILVASPTARARIADIEAHPWYRGLPPGCDSAPSLRSSCDSAHESSPIEHPATAPKSPVSRADEVPLDMGIEDGEPATPGGSVQVSAFEALNELAGLTMQIMLPQAGRTRGHADTFVTNTGLTGVIACINSALSRLASRFQFRVALVGGGAARITIKDSSRANIVSIWATLPNGGVRVHVKILDVASNASSRSVRNEVVAALRA